MTETYRVLAGKIIFTKDPDAILDYALDFTGWLDAMGDALASHTVVVAGGIVKDSSAIDGKKVVVWVSGGTVGAQGSVTVHVVTTGGRADDRTIYFKIKER